MNAGCPGPDPCEVATYQTHLFIINPDRARPDLIVVTARAELVVERRSFGPDLEGCRDANRLAEIELRLFDHLTESDVWNCFLLAQLSLAPKRLLKADRTALPVRGLI